MHVQRLDMTRWCSTFVCSMSRFLSSAYFSSHKSYMYGSRHRLSNSETASSWFSGPPLLALETAFWRPGTGNDQIFHGSLVPIHVKKMFGFSMINPKLIDVSLHALFVWIVVICFWWGHLRLSWIMLVLVTCLQTSSNFKHNLTCLQQFSRTELVLTAIPHSNSQGGSWTSAMLKR